MGSDKLAKANGKKTYSKEARKKQILDAAIRCVIRSGFHGAGMAEIAKEAGVNVGLIYRHFTNKDAIIDEIVNFYPYYTAWSYNS